MVMLEAGGSIGGIIRTLHKNFIEKTHLEEDTLTTIKFLLNDLKS